MGKHKIHPPTEILSHRISSKNGLSIVLGGPDNTSKVCVKWQDHKMSRFSPNKVRTNKLSMLTDDV